jgi:hypothetical protein
MSAQVMQLCRTGTISRTVLDLERDLSSKEALRSELLQRGRITQARNYELKVDDLRNQLFEARSELSKSKDHGVTMQVLGILILFRVLMVLANLVCIHRVFEYFKHSAQQHGLSPSNITRIQDEFS